MLRASGILTRLFDRDVAMHAGYYVTMVWILMMLEHWYRSRAHERVGKTLGCCQSVTDAPRVTG